jgi:hypothetical protein
LGNANTYRGGFFALDDQALHVLGEVSKSVASFPPNYA